MFYNFLKLWKIRKIDRLVNDDHEVWFMWFSQQNLCKGYSYRKYFSFRKVIKHCNIAIFNYVI